MIADWDTNTVAISDLLPTRYPKLVRELRAILEKHVVPMLTIAGTKDVWIRDYAPLQIGRGEFVQFRYQPDYLRGYEHLRTKPAPFRSLRFIRQRRLSRLILDGGNVVATKQTAILTDKIDRENSTVNLDQIQTRLMEMLNVERVIVIPKEPDDHIGHADGMVRFLDEHTVAVNDYRRSNSKLAKRLESKLTKAGLTLNRLPYRPELKERAGIPSAVGNYANFLRVGNLVVLPEFGQKQDEEVRRLMEAWLPNVKLESLRCEELARDGGVLNCVTWTINI